MLIDAKANPNIANSQGVTPLSTAVITNNLDAVKKLVKAGADASILGWEGDAALHSAVRIGASDIVDV